ncbi:hypothetical protein NL108_002581 [Boleophthalmus pectinirostris]|nr:hypothetical protein NL108_002581 [Boleophthalmus pectinirostris]
MRYVVILLNDCQFCCACVFSCLYFALRFFCFFIFSEKSFKKKPKISLAYLMFLMPACTLHSNGSMNTDVCIVDAKAHCLRIFPRKFSKKNKKKIHREIFDPLFLPAFFPPLSPPFFRCTKCFKICLLFVYYDVWVR